MAQRKELDINLSDIPGGSKWGTIIEPEELGIDPPNTIFVEYVGINTRPGGVLLDRTYNTGDTHLYVYGDSYFYGQVDVTGLINSETDVTCPGHRLSSKKNFDIPHPNKEGWRLRHTCLEGPENAVYFRGRLKGNNEIKMPDYWQTFVDPESITVSLTQIGSSQDLIVDEVASKSIIIRSGNNSLIDCYYLIHGERSDGEKLIVEYKGETPMDYPGNNSEYSVSGYHYDVKEGKK